MKVLFAVFVFCVANCLDAFQTSAYVATTDESIEFVGCPVMRVFKGDGAGLYYHVDDYLWSNDNGFLVLNDSSFIVGPTQGSSKWGNGDDIADCVFSKRYCSETLLDTNTECEPGRWVKTTNRNWTRPSAADPNYYLTLGEHMNTQGDFPWECHRHNVDEGYVVKGSTADEDTYFTASCINDVLPEGVKYGYNYVNGRKIFVVGEGSPLPYRETSFYRVFQIESPADDSELMVYPMSGQYYYPDSVLIATPNLMGGDGSQRFPVVRQPRHTFYIRMVSGGGSNCSKTGSILVNIIQMKQGIHIAEGPEKVVAHQHTFSTNVYYTVNYEGGQVGASDPDAGEQTKTIDKPAVLAMAYDPVGSSVIVHMIKDVTRHGFKVLLHGNFPDEDPNPPTKGNLGYLAIHKNIKTFSKLWGSNTLAVAYQQSVGSEGDVEIPPNDEFNYEDDVFVFATVMTTQKGIDIFASIAEHHPADRHFRLGVGSWCNGPLIPHPNDVSVLFLATLRPASETVFTKYPSTEYLSCPVLATGPDVPSGLFLAEKNFTKYRMIGNDRYTITVDGNGTLKTYDNGAHIKAHNASCALSGTYCTYLTILNTECRGTYEWQSQRLWKNDQDTYIHHESQYSNGEMILSCKKNNTLLTRRRLRYVCDNVHIPEGIGYGLNKIGDEYVYVVGEHMMNVGWAHRLFSVTMPADGSPVWVYPMAQIWEGARRTIIKAQAYSEDANVTFVSEVDALFNNSFKLSVSKASCKVGGGELVNIFQAKRGIFTTDDNDKIAAGWASVKGWQKDCKYYNALEGGASMKFDYTPTLFVQIQDIMVGPTDHQYIYASVKNVKKKDFDADIEGYNKSEKWHVNFGWIGLQLSVARDLFGGLQYNIKTFDSYTWTVNDGGPYIRDPWILRPFVFLDKTEGSSRNHNPQNHPGSTTDVIHHKMAVYDCEGYENESKKITYSVLPIGEVTEPVRYNMVNYNANQRGCAIMRGYGACAGNLFYMHTTGKDVLTNRFKHGPTLALFKRDDGQWECCDFSMTNLNDPSCLEGGSKMVGRRIADCLTAPGGDCAKLEVYNSEHAGLYDVRVSAGTYKRSWDDNTRIRLSSESAREVVGFVHDKEGSSLGTIPAINMACQQFNPYPTSHGRNTNRDQIEGLKEYYLVNEHYDEGPGSGYGPSNQKDLTSGVVWYKYFQVDVTDADAQEHGLYVSVPGAAFYSPVAFATAFRDSDAPLSIVFRGVSKNGLRIEPRTASCKPSFGTERVNVLIVEKGTRETFDGSVVFESEVDQMTENRRFINFTFSEQPGVTPATFSNIQDTNISKPFLNSRLTIVNPVQGSVYLEFESGKFDTGSWADVALLAVRLNRAVNTSIWYTGRHRIFGEHVEDDQIGNLVTGFDMTDLEWDTEPFMLAQVASRYETDPVAMRIDRMTSWNYYLAAVEPVCDGSHQKEDWSVLMLGESLRAHNESNRYVG